MTSSATKHSKTTKPHAAFDTPGEVVADPALSVKEKVAALESLEQDARQLSVASGEGMAGGEPTGLHDVLEARDALERPQVAQAYDAVSIDLRSRLKAAGTIDEHAAIMRAMTALDAVLPTPARHDEAGSDAKVEPAAGSIAEMEAELALEKLDP
jgi:hypothetical protein